MMTMTMMMMMQLMMLLVILLIKVAMDYHTDDDGDVLDGGDHDNDEDHNAFGSKWQHSMTQIVR